jgi:DNA-directed RNA polymerase specialized sigma24 family protein
MPLLTDINKYAFELTENQEQADLIIYEAIEALIEMNDKGNIKPGEAWEFILTTVRNKCYDYLRLKQFLSESL